MTRADDLFLHESILLLALRDEEGTVISGTSYTYALGGALLAELLLRERLAIEHARGKPLVVVSSTDPVGDEILDECLRRVAGVKRRASASTWVSRFGGTHGLRHRVAEGLCRRGVLRADTDSILGIFSRRIYPERDPEPERVLVARIRDAILGRDDALEPRTAIVVALCHAANMLKTMFPKAELRDRRERLDRIVAGELTGAATKAAVEAMQAAIIASSIASTVAVTTAH